jgi:hypothetical protein
MISQGSDPTQFTFNIRNWPIGSLVRYTGERVAKHTGLVGEIIGYRPTNGLWLKFPNDKGSISVKYAVLVQRASL